jgi:hypothetical protein
MASDRVFTAEELAQFDGGDGRPTFIAVKGVVYDVSSAAQFYGKGRLNRNQPVACTARQGWSKSGSPDLRQCSTEQGCCPTLQVAPTRPSQGENAPERWLS